LSQRVQPGDSLFDYFHLRVQEARAERGAALSDDSLLYVSQLLVDRARTDHEVPRADTLAELDRKSVV